MAERKLISVVIPIHEEQDCLRSLYAELAQTLQDQAYDFEFIFVNDGSTDGSIGVIRELHADDPRVKLIDFSRNYGHQVALTAGTYAAQGHAVIHMDGDLQHPPAMIPTFLERWENGVQIVETQKLATKDYPLPKSLLTWMFYSLFNRISEIKLDPLSSDFRLLDRQAVDAMNAFQDQERFLRGITQAIGFEREVIGFEPGPRFAGTSKYTYRKMLGLASAGLFNFTKLPLQLSFLLGLILVTASMIYALTAVIFYLIPGGYNVVKGWTSIILIFTTLSGINLLCIGVIGVYVAKIFDQVRQRPLFLVRQTLGIDDMPNYS